MWTTNEKLFVLLLSLQLVESILNEPNIFNGQQRDSEDLEETKEFSDSDDDSEDGTRACSLASMSCTTKRADISEMYLRKLERYIFKSSGKSLASADMQEVILVLRFQHEQRAKSRISPEHHHTMDLLRWLDEISKLKCRVSDLFDRAEMVASLSLKYQKLTSYLVTIKKEQNKLCTENLMNDLMEKIEEKLTNKQRGTSIFLWYNVNANKGSEDKLYSRVPMDVFHAGAGQYLLPRGSAKLAREKRRKKKMLYGAKLDVLQDKNPIARLYHHQRDHLKSFLKSPPAVTKLSTKVHKRKADFERVFHELVDDACLAVHENLLKYSNYFENLLLVGDLAEISINERLLEWISIIRVCEIVVKQEYSFDKIYLEIQELKRKTKVARMLAKRTRSEELVAD